MIQSKGIDDSLAALTAKLRTSSRVFYTRFGDGDIYLMDGKSKEKYHDNSSALQKELVNSFLINDDAYLKGLSVNYPVEPGMTDGMFKPFPYNKSLAKVVEKIAPGQQDFFNPILFHYLYVFRKEQFEQFIHDHVAGKKKMFIGCCSQKAMESLFGKIDYHIPTPERNSYGAIKEWWPGVLRNIEDVEVVIPATGIATRIVQGRLWEMGVNIHSLDVGSVVDAQEGTNSRTWIKMLENQKIKQATGSNQKTKQPQKESNVGKWEPVFRRRKNAWRTSDKTTYKLAAEFLKDCAEVEDWGCGQGAFRHFYTGKLLGIDGSKTPAVAKLKDLCDYKSNTEGILIRHVLEHNTDWEKILANAAKSFRYKLCIVLYTPFSPGTRQIGYNKTIDVPEIAFAKADIIKHLEKQGLDFRLEENIPSKTQHKSENIFYVTRGGGGKIPLIIPNFNQLYFLKNLVNWYRTFCPDNPVFIIDNASDYQPLIEFYQENKDPLVTVVKHDKNDCGSNLRKFLDTSIHPTYKYYCISNPDILPHPGTPENFLEIFRYCIDKMGFHKAGFQLITDDLPDYADNKKKVLKDQEAFCKEEVAVEFKEQNYTGFKAAIDLTFAMYATEKGGWEFPKRPNWNNSIRILRAFHLGWYIHPQTTIGEHIHYFKTALTKPQVGKKFHKGLNNYRPATFS